MVQNRLKYDLKLEVKETSIHTENGNTNGGCIKSNKPRAYGMSRLVCADDREGPAPAWAAQAGTRQAVHCRLIALSCTEPIANLYVCTAP